MAPNEWTARVARALDSKGVPASCMRCGSLNRMITEKYLSFSVVDQPHMTVNNAPDAGVLPTVGVVCADCGFVALHMVASLGLV